MLYANTANAAEIGASAKTGYFMQIDFWHVFAIPLVDADAEILLINVFV